MNNCLTALKYLYKKPSAYSSIVISHNMQNVRQMWYFLPAILAVPVPNVTTLCHPVSPFKTLHTLYLSRLCQRVTLFLKNYKYRNIIDRKKVVVK